MRWAKYVFALASAGLISNVMAQNQTLPDVLFSRVQVVNIRPALTLADRAAITSLLPLQLKGGQVVDSVCRQDAQPEVTLLDLNHDGQAEVVVNAGNACIDGQTGSSITVLGKIGNEWRVLLRTPAIEYRLLDSHGQQGYSDLLLMGRSTCFGRWRFTGAAYTHAGNIDERGKSCK